MKYSVKCLECKSKRQVNIVTSEGRELIDWLDNNPNPEAVRIISGRKRFDGNFGWQCICGNNDIMTKQEQSYITNKQSPSPNDVASLVKNLLPQKPQFEMRAI